MTTLLVPAYFHPAIRPGDWELLVENASSVRAVVLNIASGPGSRVDQEFVPVVARLRDAGVTVAGYVDTDYGHRPAAGILAEMDRYAEWYGVAGVFFDRVSARRADLPEYAALSGAARAMGLTTVAFNHGVHPAEEYAAHADLLGTFEGPWRMYQGASVPRWVRSWPPERFFHLVFSVPSMLLPDALALARLRHAGSAFVTDLGGANPWQYLPRALVTAVAS
jgi:spherulation-specific family 4 protein